jgi:hypothetical protein
MLINSSTTLAFSTFGYRLVDNVNVRQETLNLLFTALILTVVGVFIGGNLLLSKQAIFWPSFLITMYCLAILFNFYAFSRFLNSIPWALVLVYSLLWVVIFTHWAMLFYAPSFIAIFYSIRFLRLSRKQWCQVFLMALIGSASILGVADAYTSFDMIPRLHVGSVTQDTLFHASIAAMIKNYGVVSTGLHGLIETPYHAFSHSLMASISFLSGISVIETYGVASWVLFSPLLVFCVVACCAMIDHSQKVAVPLVWGFASLLLTILPYFLIKWAVWDSFFVSESYLVSLGLFVLSFAMLFKVHLSWRDLIFIFVSGVLITESKGSVGLIYSGLWLTRLLFVKGSSKLPDGSAFVLSAMTVGWALSRSAVGVSDIFSINQMHFVADFSLWGSDLRGVYKVLLDGDLPSGSLVLLALLALTTFIVFHFLLSWLVVLQGIRHSSVWKVLGLPIGVYSLAATFAGVIVCFAASIPGGSGYYFSNVATFVSLPAVSAMLTFWCGRRAIDQRLILAFILIAVIFVGMPRYDNLINRYPKNSTKVDDLLITKLRDLRESAQLNTILQAGSDLITMNPVESCTAQPFVFPAVSERAWTGVITPKSGKCSYKNYGYQQYQIQPDTNEIAASVGPLLDVRTEVLLISK